MKKLALLGLLPFALLANNSYASLEVQVDADGNEYYNVPVSSLTSEGYDIKYLTTDLTTVSANTISTEDMEKDYSTILNNNNLIQDNTYNYNHYFTTKIDTSNIVIPDEIKNNSSRIYFLVEEGKNIIMYKTMNTMAEMSDISTVQDEYNYKIVDFDENKTEYTFNNKDLVKDFTDDESKVVYITLVADLNNGETINLSDSLYVRINDKETTLSNIMNDNLGDYDYFGYYSSSNLASYLASKGESMTKTNYKKVLEDLESKTKKLLSQNADIKTQILENINSESDFSEYVEKYALYTQTNDLLTNILNATKTELKRVRAEEFIDKIF